MAADTDTILTPPAVGKWVFVNGKYEWSIPGGTPTTPMPTQTNVTSTPETRAAAQAATAKTLEDARNGNTGKTPFRTSRGKGPLNALKDIFATFGDALGFRDSSNTPAVDLDAVSAAQAAADAAAAANAPPPTAAMPTPGDAADLAEKRRSRVKSSQRRGRTSTILSDETLGA